MEYGRDEINRAFWDLGLRFQWDDPTWRNLVGHSSLCDKLRQYLGQHQPHLLKIYDCESIAKMVEQRLASPIDARVGIEAHHSF